VAERGRQRRILRGSVAFHFCELQTKPALIWRLRRCGWGR
jgi:hypothetical protein